MSKREMYFNGSFYPAESKEILRFITAFDDIKTLTEEHTPRAMIVPHAGYIYSGFTANLAYHLLPSDRRIIVIGPSHRVAFEGISIALYDKYATPLGNLKIDRTYAEELQSRFEIAFAPEMHREHSTEVQMPFIKHYAPDARVVEMVYGNYSPEKLSEIIAALLQEKENIVVISTDLSHFYTEEVANELDTICLHAIKEEKAKLLHEGCEACGKIGVEGVIIAAKAAGLTSQLLDYRTSSWSSGDTSNVVGYTSAIFY